MLAGCVIALLFFVAAGHGYFKVHRDIRRKRVIQGARDIAATEKLVEQKARTSGERHALVLADRYRAAFEHSNLAGWRIYGDR